MRANLNSRLKIELRCCDTFWFGYFRKREHCESLLTLFRTFLHYEKIVINTIMGYDLTSIDVLYTWMRLNLLALHVIACCVKLDM